MRITLLTIVFFAFSAASTAQSPRFTALVNPFVGTDAHGHTHPAAMRPFGMVQLGPDTRTSLMDWDACSGYHYSDTVVYGFSHTHLSGTGVPDYNDILVLPFVGGIQLDPERNKAAFDKSSEKASPGYYALTLSGQKIRCEMTATERVGVHRYTFPVHREIGRLLVDLRHRDQVLESGLRYVNNREIAGYRISKSWAERQTIYFVMRFSKPFSHSNLLDLSQDPQVSAPEVQSQSVAGVLHFYHEGEPLVVTVGISAVSEAGARRNLEAECPDFDFDAVRAAADTDWNSWLSKIEVEGGALADQRTFYTALYHSAMAPNIWSDVDGAYRGMDGAVHQANHTVYTVFSLWDTYRAANPLHALLAPDRMRDFIRTFLRHYREGGLLPVWELAANETNCMIGNHAIPVILDAYTKGLVEEADALPLLEAMQKSAEMNRLGLAQYQKKGFIPANEEPESVSKTLEYTFDDWCISRMASLLRRPEVSERYARRAQYYQNLFDPASGFFRGKSNGTWHQPFDPREVNFNYTEANAWQYRFSIQHDIPGMVRLMGGKDAFIRQLDQLFAEPAQTTGRNQADITGLIGQYAHGNEPCHHVAYLYSALGAPEKTVEKVRQIRKELYSDQPDGLCGNDDCGQMSAWYVWSAMGMYPVTPGSGQYVLGAPLFSRCTLRLPHGKVCSINAEQPEQTPGGVWWNGKALEQTVLTHKNLMEGGDLAFLAGREGRRWGGAAQWESTLPAFQPPAPFVAQGKRVFVDRQRIELGCADPSATIFYSLGKRKTERYTRPLEVEETQTLRFYAERNGVRSFEDTAIFYRKNNQIKVLRYTHPYSPQYTGGGDEGLVDLLSGGADFRSGGWQGFEGKDLEVVLDLGKKQPIEKVSGHFFQDENAWIFFPVRMEVEVSDDGVHFRAAGAAYNEISVAEKGLLQQDLSVELSRVQARYLRVRGMSLGQCPPTHKGAGYPCWVFVDEIKVE